MPSCEEEDFCLRLLNEKKKIPVNASLSTITFIYTTSGVQAGQSSRERTYFVMRET